MLFEPALLISYLCVSIIVLAAFYAFALYWLGTFFNGVYSDFMGIEEKTSHFTRFFSAKSIFLMLSILLIYLDGFRYSESLRFFSSIGYSYEQMWEY